MPEKILKFQGFKAAERPVNGIAMIFDISGFTNFFNKPDLHYYITDYINHIISCVEVNIYGGKSYWLEDDEEAEPLDIAPSLRKFLGDGMLYIWEIDALETDFIVDFKVQLINSMWNLQLNFDKIKTKLYDVVPTGDLPATIKFGIAQGTIYKIDTKSGAYDYIGTCINLASRLVKYCPDINFICSAKLNLPKTEIETNGYLKVIAKELRSFEKDIVIIDKSDYNSLKQEDKIRLFKKIS